MSTIIRDGTGTGIAAKVTSDNRIYVSSVSQTEKDHAADEEGKYNINTGDITLTSAAKTTVLYLKNNEDEDFFLTAAIYNLGSSTGGSGDVKIEVIRNPNATGDIITNANAVESVINLNFGSSQTLNALVYKGATGETVLAGTEVALSTRSSSSTGRIFIDLGAIIIPKGSSVSINYTPPTGNTSQICQFAFACFLKTFDV